MNYSFDFKHIHIDTHFIRELVQLVHVKSALQIIDLLSKSLTAAHFQTLLFKTSVVCTSDLEGVLQLILIIS